MPLGDDEARSLLADWPAACPRGWIRRVNQAETAGELDALRLCVARGRPYGGPAWTERKTPHPRAHAAAPRGIKFPISQRFRKWLCISLITPWFDRQL